MLSEELCLTFRLFVQLLYLSERHSCGQCLAIKLPHPVAHPLERAHKLPLVAHSYVEPQLQSKHFHPLARRNFRRSIFVGRRNRAFSAYEATRQSDRNRKKGT